MSTCKKCNLKVSREMSIQCSGPCLAMFHKNIGCAPSATPSKSKGWKCPQCLQRSPANIQKRSANNFSHDIAGTSNLNYSLEATLKEIKVQLEGLNDKYQALQSQFSTLSAAAERINTLEDKVGDLENEMENLKSQVTRRDEKIDDLEWRLCQSEQYSRKNNFEIRELEHKEGEVVQDIIMKLAQKMEIPLQKTDIQAAHRLKHRPGKQTGIIVSLKDRMTRDRFVSSKLKVVNGDLINNSAQPSKKVYIGASLSPFFTKLLMEAKALCRANNYKYCWWAGAVKVRKEDGSPVIVINRMSHLDLII